MTTVDVIRHTSSIREAGCQKFLMAASCLFYSKPTEANAHHQYGWRVLRSVLIIDEKRSDTSNDNVILTDSVIITPARCMTCHQLSRTTPSSCKRLIEWPQCYETSADMTQMSLSWQTVANRIWGHAWQAEMKEGPVYWHCEAQHLFFVLPEGKCRIFQNRRLSPNGTRNNDSSNRWCPLNISPNTRESTVTKLVLLYKMEKSNTTLHPSIFRLLSQMVENAAISKREAIPAETAFCFELQITISAKVTSANDVTLKNLYTPSVK